MELTTSKGGSSKKRAVTREDSDEEEQQEDKENQQEDDEGSEQEEEEEEYEIEAILVAKKGTFPEGRYGYLVKWKGYDESHNSWVDEKDAGNAQSLIDEFWEKKFKKAGRKSITKSTKSSEEPKSTDAKRKRGRASQVVKDLSSEEERSEDETKKRSAKRPKKASTTAATSVSASKKRARSSSGSEDNESENNNSLASMDKWMNLESWEGLVGTIDTIEREDGKKLNVYFTLTTGERTKQPSDICHKKFPQKMIRFYEGHLRWLEAP